MKTPSVKSVRGAIYTRVSTEQGLDQEFNSLDAQYDAASAYIRSQAHAGWTLIRSRYDDGGYSGGGPPTVPICKGCWTIYAPERLTSSWSTRSISDFSRPCIIGYGSSPSRCGPTAVAERSIARSPGSRARSVCICHVR